ncbi:hypothetical protein SAMN04488238_10197 [Roseicitreum antarcticum]|uniref:Uncharacterized protein n=1 Tax=Roseicitreum antarcticum TaxID=564137 RepID=A0A1H2QUE2_9RHOB|nr:hypothetical protein SAMN04488238_10197 [Roseicitreum antarcticum]
MILFPGRRFVRRFYLGDPVVQRAKTLQIIRCSHADPFRKLLRKLEAGRHRVKRETREAVWHNQLINIGLSNLVQEIAAARRRL